MAASDHLQPQQFFHGTDRQLPVGGYLKSHLENRRVHFTTDKQQARLWASDSGESEPQVYEVHPEGEVQQGRGVGGYASHDPVRIGRRVL